MRHPLPRTAALASLLTLCACGSAASSSSGGAADTESVNFAPAVHYPVDAPIQLAIGDFDGDTNLDLAISLATSGLVVTYGDGHGGFGAPVSVGSDGSDPGPSLMQPYDINADGRDDLFLGGGEAPFGGVSLCLSMPGRTWSAPNNLAGATNGMFSLGDVDGDGVVDVVSWYAGGTQISYLLSGGAGVRTTFDFAGFPADFAADLNGDKKADLVGQTTDMTNTEVALTGSDGQPGTFSDYPLPTSAKAAPVPIDVNNDGVMEPLTLASDNTLFVQPIQHDGTLGNSVSTPPVFSNDASIMGTGDLDGDHLPDLVMTDFKPGDSMAILRGDGTGGFHQVSTNLTNEDFGIIATFAIGDLNHDGKNDIVMLDATNFVVLLQQ
jgi:hypothetical protein